MNSNTRLVRPLRNGQITLPAAFRRALQLDLAPLLQITLEGQELRLRAFFPEKLETGSVWLRDLYFLLAPARRAAADLTDHDPDALIDLALATLRSKAHVSRRP